MNNSGNRPLPSKESRTFFGYSDDDDISRLEDRLGELAMLWRDKKEEKYVTEYHRVLNELLSLGWNDYLDADAQLPKERMPPQYFERRH